MKIIIKLILTTICWLWSKVYTYRLSVRIKSLWDVVYTLWLRNYLGHVGEGSSIAYPCSLQGGGQKSISIGNNTGIQSHCILGCWENYRYQKFSPSITIGDNCCIGEYNHITACNKVTIGDGLLTGRFVYIGDNAHGGLSFEEVGSRPVERCLISKGQVIIGRNVWIGDKVTILAGVNVGDNVIIGANSVVTKDIPQNTIVAGTPAKIIKQLNVCQNHD